LLETPDTGFEYLLEKLGDQEESLADPLFEELYSWYLRQPEYSARVKKLTEAAFIKNPRDRIGKSVAKALYGEVSLHGATRLERYAACAYAHFLRYGMMLTERAEYEFRAMDMGNVIHQALEKFAGELRSRGLEWKTVSDRERDRLAED